MKRCVIYSRVSTDAQEREGTSLDTQEQASREHAEAEGWVVVDALRDTASGFTLERPALTRLRESARAGQVDVVLAHALDRLSRKQTHVAILVEEMEQLGVGLEFVTEEFEATATGQLLRSVKAFAAELEREKIAERTMRGKLERARSGKLPQGTGRGCYGYVYSPQTGKREIEPSQADIVRRIFQRFTETRSFSAVSNELNHEGVPAFSGGRWYPPTIRRVLINPSYIGRTTYRRTKRERAGGKTRVVERPVEDWIIIEGSTPAILEAAAWEGVQAILADPERTKRRPTVNSYPLRSRVTCSRCGGAMVGQTLRSKGRPYRYYRCRHAYDRNTARECSARYVRAGNLESGVWTEVKKVLSAPEVVLRELELERAPRQEDSDKVDSLEGELRALKSREQRLVRLFSFAEVDDDAVRAEASEVTRRREVVEQQLESLSRSDFPHVGPIDEVALRSVCRRIENWLEQAEDHDRALALDALQVQVTADRDAAAVSGVIPLEAEPGVEAFITDEQSSRCSSSGE